MSKLTLIILASIVAYATSQDSAGGGGGGDDASWKAKEPQIAGKGCSEITKDNCLFIDEAHQHCKATCEERQNNPNSDPTPAPQQQQPQQNGPKKKKGCFHGQDLVQTKEHGQITMSRLAELRSAQVLTRNDEGRLEYASVRYWLHSQPNVDMKFYQLRTRSGHRLSITGEHLIYETDCRGGPGRAIFAKNVQIDRCLYVNDNGQLIETPIVEKEAKKLRGIYSPITTTGSIVVNDVLASCYNYFENESLQKFVYQYVIGFQDALASWAPASVYEAAFNSQHGAVVAVPRIILNFLQLSNYFVH